MKSAYLKIIFLCVTALIMSMTSTAEAKPFELLDGKIKIGGQARFRYEHFNNTDFVAANDTRDFILTRLRVSLTLIPHEQIVLFFQPQFTAGWGESTASLSSVDQSSNAVGGVANSGTVLNDPTLGVHQGYLAYSPTDWFTVKLGRQELIYGDHLVVGNVGWSNSGRSFDAVKFKFTGDIFWVDFLYALLLDVESGVVRGANAAGTSPSGDAHFMGIYSSLDLGDFFKAVDLYALYRFNQTARPRPHNYVTAGLRIKAKPNNWDYRFEATGQIGKLAGANQRDWQFDLEGGYTWEDFYKFRLALEAFVTSRNYNQLFPTAHKWLGFIDLFGRRNIMGGVLHLSAQPSEKWLVKLDAHGMFRTKTSAGLFRLNGVTPIGAVGASTSRFAGVETDLTVRYKPLDLLSFQAGFNAFIPAGFVRTNVGSKVPLFGYLQTNLVF